MFTRGQLERYADSLDGDGKTNLQREIGNIQWYKEKPKDPDIVCLDSQVILAFERAGLISKDIIDDTRLHIFQSFARNLKIYTEPDDIETLAPYDEAAGLATAGADRY